MATSAVGKRVLISLGLGMCVLPHAMGGISYSRVAFHEDENVKLRQQLHVTGGEERMIIEETTEILASRKSGQLAQVSELVLEDGVAGRIFAKLSALILSRAIESTSLEHDYRVASEGGSQFQLSFDLGENDLSVRGAIPTQDANLGKLNAEIEKVARDCLLENEELIVHLREETESDNAPPVRVRLSEITAAPERFAGKRVEITGFLILEHEGDALYETKSDALGSQQGPSIWIETENDRTLGRALTKLNKRYVRLVGVFTTLNKGHFSLWSGSLVRLTEAGAAAEQ